MANTGQNTGTNIPTTQIWDVSQIYSTPDLPGGLKELLVRMYQNLNLMAQAVNLKEAGYYDTFQEFVNGQLFFPNPLYDSANTTNPTRATYRQVYRKVINFGALPNAGTKSVPHGLTITPTTTLTRLYGASTKPGIDFIPLPYPSSVAGNIIELDMDATNINITTASDKSAYTITYVVIEILKQ